MKNKIIVFDFDKTLTYNDTLFGFFVCASKINILFPLKVGIYFTLMVLAKIKLLSNTKLKEFGVLIFLKNKSSSELRKSSVSYKKTIKFNKLFSKYNFNNENIYIVSASFEDYLNSIFTDNVTIIGSQLTYSQDLVCGLKFNCYNKNKIDALANANVFKISEFYTDSYSDFPLASISEKIIIVNGDRLHVCNNINEFNTYFGKPNK